MKNIDISLRLGWFVRSNTREITDIARKSSENPENRKQSPDTGLQFFE
jgi:hypothetical protein